MAILIKGKNLLYIQVPATGCSVVNVTELRDSIKTPKLFNQTSDFKLEKLSLFIYSFKEISACLAAGYELCKI